VNDPHSGGDLPVEIERKYLLRGRPDFPPATAILEIDQGYLPGEQLAERLRRQRHPDGVTSYFRTIKFGAGVRRIEIEEETDARTFEHLWQLTEGRRLTKRRYIVPHGEDVWEIDEFTDRPLWLAELELDHPESHVEIPRWLAPVLVREVTDERAFSNRSLAR
jgi:adenylate cyclase